MSKRDDFPGSLGFVILSPEPNIARLNDTVRSIRVSFGGDARIVCCVAKGTKKAQLEEMKAVCPTVRGGETVTSLINSGFGGIKGEGWRMFVMEGARMPRGVEKRYRTWIDGERDVLFPIVVNHDRDGRPASILANFEDCTLNGMLIHSRLFNEVGEFTDNPMPVSKGFWAMGALVSGAVFKAVLGVKII